MEQKWLVEIHPDFRRDTGEFETVVADSVHVADGCLMFERCGGTVLVRAAGTWLSMVPLED